MLSLSFRFFVEKFIGLGNTGAISSAPSGGGDSASGVVGRTGATMVKAAVLSVDGSSTFSCSSSIGSGAFSLVEIECQIAISIVMVQITTTIIRTIRAVVGIMPSQRNNENSD